jgi:hypothetical protein
MNHRFLLGLACFAIAVVACNDEDSTPRPDAGRDTRPIDMNVPADAAPDLRQIADVGVDTAVDVAVDAAVDVGVDTAVDVAVDAADQSGPPLDGSATDVTTAEVTPDGAAEASTPDAEDAFFPYDTVPACGSVHRADVCFSYCDGMGRFCTGANKQYQNANECMAVCKGPTWACGNPSDFTGNSLYCRVVHMTFAGVGAAAAECPNAGPDSPVCK